MMTLQVNRTGVCFKASEAEAERLRRQFDQHHFLRLEQFLAPSLLKEIQAEIRGGKFAKKVHKDIAVELCAKEGPALRILKFVCEDRPLFSWIQRLTGCEKIGCFTGRIYRMDNRGSHHDDWHNDMTEHRMVAMSVNLSEKVYKGGHLVLRRRGEPSTEVTIPNTEPGGALLFRLSSELEHRVLDVESEEPKTAFAGWFRSRPDFLSQVKNLRKRRKKTAAGR